MTNSKKNEVAVIALIASVLCCALFLKQAVVALAIGIVVGLVFENPHSAAIKRWVPRLLGAGVVGLGLTSSFAQLKPVLGHLFDITVLVGMNLLLAVLLARLLGVSKTFSFLMASGTAICGGSAIVATAAALKPPEEETAVALTTVFALNALSLLLLPLLSNYLELDAMSYGLWASLAIHDTASVMAAVANQPPEVFAYGASVKLLRTLFIVPTVLLITLILNFQHKGQQQDGVRRPGFWKLLPWFIPAYVVALMINHFGFIPTELTPTLRSTTKSLMIAALFLVGTGISLAKLKKLGVRPIAVGVCMWICSAIAAYFFL